MKLFTPIPRAGTPKQPGEVEYSNLDLTRERHRDARKNNFIIAALVVIVFGGLAFYGASRANDNALKKQNDRIEEALDQIVAARTESRHTTCARDNTIRHDAGDAAAKKAQDFIDSQKAYTHAGPSTGQLLAAEKAYVESQRRVTLEAYPRRDCTTAGIDAYYKNPPPPPEDGLCVPDGKGLCKP